MKPLIIHTFLLLSITGYDLENKAESRYSDNMQTNDEAEITNIAHLLTKLMIEKDTVSMNQILDNSFTLTHITGYVQPKKEWFAEIADESMKYYSTKEVMIKVKLNGNHAECVFRNMLDARIWGSRNTWPLQQTLYLEKQAGNWIILKSVATTF